MATRLIGTDSEDPRLPQVVIDASIGTGPNDLAAGNAGGGFVGSYTTEEAPDPATVTPGHYYFDLTLGSPWWSTGSEWVGGGTGGGGSPPGSATGAVAGAPGEFTPEGSDIPAALSQLIDWAVDASPSTVWDAGDYVVLGDASHAYWDGDDWLAGEAPEPIPLTVGFTAVPGETFAPWVGLTDTTTITWTNSVGATLGTGATPSFTVPVNGIINMVVEDESLVDFLNFGFDNLQDQGASSLPNTLNWPPTSLTGVTTPMTDIPNLRYFMAADTELTGNLDISGHPHLEYIECFHAHVETCDLTGCTSLIRLCFETNSLSEIDLTPVRLSMSDFRGAQQGGASPPVYTCTGTLPNLYHYCVQGNPGATNIPVSQMPILVEWWGWDCAATNIPVGEEPVSTQLRSLILEGNPYNADSLNRLIIRLAEIGFANGNAVNYNGGLGAPDATVSNSLANGARALLLSRAWNIAALPTAVGDTTSGGIFPAHTHDGTATGWTSIEGGFPTLAVWQDLLTGAWTGYRRITPTSTARAAGDVFFEITADRTSFSQGAHVGIFANADTSGNGGARVMFGPGGSGTPGIGLSDGPFTGGQTQTTLNPMPSGWTDPGSHTLGVRIEGAEVTAVCDGVDVTQAAAFTPYTGTWPGGRCGMLGNSNYVSRSWSDVTWDEL